MSFTMVIDDAVVSAQHLFSSYGKTIIVPGRDIEMNASQTDALIIRSRTQINETLLQNNPRIRFIGSTVVGLDHVDLDACQRHGVTFYSAQGCNARSVAEYVIAQIVTYTMQRNTTFAQLTLGIVGVGHVGSQVQHLAEALGIRCLLNDPPKSASQPAFAQMPLNDLLSQSDIVTLHTPLTHIGEHPSYHLINPQTLAHIKAQALFINAARGDIVDEKALLRRPDLTLVTDCWHHEPDINDALLQRSALATPHIAGHAWDAKFRGGQMVSKALADWRKVPYTLLPAPENTINITPITTTDNVAQLNNILQQVYDFAQDDAQLRSAKSADRAKVFEDYRRHYPMRREWSTVQTSTEGLNTIVKQWLEKMSFNIRKI